MATPTSLLLLALATSLLTPGISPVTTGLLSLGLLLPWARCAPRSGTSLASKLLTSHLASATSHIAHVAVHVLATAHHIATTVLASHAPAWAHIASAVGAHTERHAPGSSHGTTTHLTSSHGATSHHSSGLEATTLEHSTMSPSWTTSHLTASHILSTSTTHIWHASMLVSTASFRLIFMLFAKSFFLGILVVLSDYCSSLFALQFCEDDFLERRNFVFITFLFWICFLTFFGKSIIGFHFHDSIVRNVLAFSFFLGLSPGLIVLL